MICARHVVATRSSEVSRQSGQLRQKQAVVDLYRSDFVFMHQVSFVLPFGQMEFKHRVEAVKSAVMTEMDAKLPRDVCNYTLRLVADSLFAKTRLHLKSKKLLVIPECTKYKFSLLVTLFWYSIWLTLQARKLNQILCCDWLPERATWGFLPARDSP